MPAQKVNEVMTHDPRTVDSGAPLVEAAREMKEADAGAILVADDGRFKGLVTDRDIVVRAIAEGKDPKSTTVGEICTSAAQTLTPDSSVEDAIRLMREHAIRRIPVVQDGRPVGIVAIGDLAIERDEDSALADISAARGNN
ncbi:MAG TPA: CBS domain-containing protein [Solirubrobacteraceae bacterium]|nr:CBS domain-containing protein [Solirubrobacteraceae bacterium]